MDPVNLKDAADGNLWNLLIGVISWAGIAIGLSVLIRAINARNEQAEAVNKPRRKEERD